MWYMTSLIYFAPATAHRGRTSTDLLLRFCRGWVGGGPLPIPRTAGRGARVAVDLSLASVSTSCLSRNRPRSTSWVTLSVQLPVYVVSIKGLSVAKFLEKISTRIGRVEHNPPTTKKQSTKACRVCMLMTQSRHEATCSRDKSSTPTSGWPLWPSTGGGPRTKAFA
jgi:hypothetical protein